MRCVENHDQPRIQRLAPDAARTRAWTAFAAFQPGAFLIYAGQESGTDHAPSLFERDPIDWASHPLQGFLARLGALKKEPALAAGGFHILSAEPAVQAAWLAPEDSLYGVFSVAGGSRRPSRSSCPTATTATCLRTHRSQCAAAPCRRQRMRRSCGCP